MKSRVWAELGRAVRETYPHPPPFPPVLIPRTLLAPPLIHDSLRLPLPHKPPFYLGLQDNVSTRGIGIPGLERYLRHKVKGGNHKDK